MPLPFRSLSLLTLAAACTGCTMTYSGAPEGPGSATFQLNRPFTVPAPPGGDMGALPPPTNLLPAPPLGAAPAPAQGPYVGRTEVMYGGEFRDCQPLTMTDFRVEGNIVRFGPFVGRIAQSGAVAMQAGPTYISGQFEGSHFQGRYWAPPPNCTYALSFDPATH